MSALTIANLGLGANRMPRSAQHCLQGGVSSPLMALLTALLALLAVSARAATTDDVLSAAHAVRAAGCMQFSGVDVPLHAQPQLDAVASQMLQGRPLEAALASAAYHADAASSMRIQVRKVARERIGMLIENTFAERFCAPLTDAELVDIGAASNGQDVWIVVAKPFAPPRPEAAQAVHQRVLELVNLARSQGRRCGRQQFDAAAPLARSAALERAAIARAGDLATSGELTHRGRDGSGPAERVSRENYAWSSVAENLAADASSAEQVVDGWLRSPSHCANLMNPKFTDMGIAYVVTDRGASGIYWVQVFAAALRAR